MRDEEEIFQTNLERCSYRFLQQTAKAMGLPSNVKKVYLIQLINAKNYGTPRDLDLLVRHVRVEQKRQALIRKAGPKKRQQSREISSTSQSPPIITTPRRLGHIFIHYSPEVQSPKKYPQTVASRRLPATRSDRVLRSSNRVTKPSYLLNNTLMSLMKDERSETKVKSTSTEEIRKASRSFAKKIIVSWQKEGKVVPVRSANNSPPLGKRPRRLSGVYPLQPEDLKKPCVVVRRADGSYTKLNAIFRSQLSQDKYDRQKQFDNLNPSIFKANATPSVMSKMVQNSTISSNFSEMNSNLNYRPNELSSSFTFGSSNTSEVALSLSNRQSNMLNSPDLALRTHVSETAQNSGYKRSVSEMSPTNNYRATNNFSFSSGSDETTLSSTSRDNLSAPYREYYHKKIRAEQIRSLRRSREMTRTVENDCRLPKINEVFSNFSSVYSGDVMQPLYVQVDSEHGIAPNPSNIPDPRMQYQGTNSLETIFNLKMPRQTTRHMPSMTNTHTVYSTPVICTTKTQPSATDVHNQHDAYNVASPPRESQPFFMNETEGIPSANDFFSNFHYHEENNNNNGDPNSDFQRSCSSVETITSQEQELAANLSIPEMVEDALEIISQDGDYMERMGMDIRMQCILCNWAGPKIILEYHIRKEHPSDIVQCAGSELSTSFALGALCARAWRPRLLQRGAALYVLSAKYDEHDCFLAALATVSYNPDDPKTCSLTIYNKVTGEPFTWTGEVTDLPPCMPYENDPNCFRLQISKMDLLPNSANLKLLNRELVLRSPSKVVVGQPELDNIHISLTVKFLN